MTLTESEEPAEVELEAELDVLDELEAELEVVVPLPELYHVTEKLPSLERVEGCASSVPDEETIVIDCTEVPKEPTGPVKPFTVAESGPKNTVPKSAKGSMDPPDDGASAIHSAELLCAELTLWVLLKLCEFTVIVTVNDPPEYLTSAVTVSPGLTASEVTWKDGFG